MALSNSLFRSFCAAQGWRVPHDGEVFGVGIRGVRLLDHDSIAVIPNTPDVYNDVLGLAGADWYLAVGTVDPGDYYTQHPTHPGGCAHLADGEHEFGIGDHRGRPALVQVGGTLLWRDADRDHQRDPGEPIHVERGNGANWHAGGYERVGPNSAACLNTAGGWQGKPWNITRDRAYGAIRAGLTPHRGVLACYVMDGAALVDFSNRSNRGH